MTLGKAAKWMSTLSLSLILAACGGEETTDDSETDTGTDDTGIEEVEGTDDAGTEDESASGDFDASTNIHVITRESGSGTRDAFVEIADITDADGEDAITQTATVQNGTSAVMQGVSGDLYSIGFISLGSLDDSVKALAVNGVEATPENISTGDYEVARNFNVTYGGELSEVAQDFWDFMDSAQAQDIVAEDGYVPSISDAPEYEEAGLSGNITVVGSTSVNPVMERFAELYMELNPDVQIDITASGSGAGVTATIDQTADIGMASRELDDEEQGQVTETKAIAIDGIAVIVHNDNPTAKMSMDNTGGIYLGEVTTWDAVQ